MKRKQQDDVPAGISSSRMQMSIPASAATSLSMPTRQWWRLKPFIPAVEGGINWQRVGGSGPKADYFFLATYVSNYFDRAPPGNGKDGRRGKQQPLPSTSRAAWLPRENGYNASTVIVK
eukprot:GHVU01008440.1.p1 GENE.GHVU01008440.1~~GHVU01008440.1.p1  ORF type:complete len:119 (+),score=8.49 GHVU01008440.1:784-1140(+)